MTEEVLNALCLKKGQKVLHITGGEYHRYLTTLTIKDAEVTYEGEEIVFIEECGGYISWCDIYTKTRLLSMLEE